MLFFYKHPDGADDVGDMLQHIAYRYVIFTNLYKSKHGQHCCNDVYILPE